MIEYARINDYANNLNKPSIASKSNERLNRYLNIFPYDSNRVVIDTDEYENDYINASYIDVSIWLFWKLNKILIIFLLRVINTTLNTSQHKDQNLTPA